MIPHIVHRIWIGGPLPADAARFEQRWRELHPQWTIRTWRDWDLPALRNQAAFDRAVTPAQKADIARLELLHRYGGVYADTDTEPLQPLDDLIAQTSCFFGLEGSGWIATGLVGAEPSHPFIAHLVDGLTDSIADHPGAPVNEQTGPKYVTSAYHHYREHGSDNVTLFPSGIFYPYHFSEPWRAGESFPEAYAVHHWSHSWEGAEGDAPAGRSPGTDTA